MSRFLDTAKDKTKTVEYHMGRIIIYAALYGIALFFYFFLYGYFQLLMLSILTVMPVASIVSAVLQSRRCKVCLTASDKCVTRGEKLEIGILLKNTSIFSSLNVRCRLCLENVFYGTGTGLTVSVPAVIKGGSTAVLPVITDRNGILRITAQAMAVSDFCGLISIVTPLALTETVQILPDYMELTEEEKAGLRTGISGSEEEPLKGNDFSDTSDIREYVPGDRMKDIHWKLSAKRDILLVKERIRIAESQLAVWLELSGSNEQTDAVLRFCYNLIRFCTEEGILVKLMWQSGREKETEEALICNGEELRQAFFLIYHSGMGSRKEGETRMTEGEGRTAQTYVHVGLHNGTAGAVVIENEA